MKWLECTGEYEAMRAEHSPAAAEKDRHAIHKANADRTAWTAVMKHGIPAQEISFSRGETVFATGEPCEWVYMVQSGVVKIGRNFQGRESLLSIAGPGEMFGELSIFDPGPRVSTATAVSEVHALVVTRSALRRWIGMHPEISERLLGVIASKLRRANIVLTDLMSTDVPGRVAKALLEFAQRFGRHEAGHLWVTHELTQMEIAQYVGASRETVNKTLSDFVDRGWVQIYGRSVLVLDSRSLGRRAECGVAGSGRARYEHPLA